MKLPMDTPDWSDSRLDAMVSGALRSTVVTPQQKRAAWQRLQERAAMQTMLPPSIGRAEHFPPAETVGAGRRFLNLGTRLLDWSLSLLFDDTRYDRALQQRHTRHGVTLFDSPLRNMLGGVAT